MLYSMEYVCFPRASWPANVPVPSLLFRALMAALARFPKHNIPPKKDLHTRCSSADSLFGRNHCMNLVLRAIIRFSASTLRRLTETSFNNFSNQSFFQQYCNSGPWAFKRSPGITTTEQLSEVRPASWWGSFFHDLLKKQLRNSRICWIYF